MAARRKQHDAQSNNSRFSAPLASGRYVNAAANRTHGGRYALDFCDERGYMGRMGYGMESLRAPIEPIARVLELSRSAGLHIIYTRQGYRPDFADVPRLTHLRRSVGRR
jgi:hypothetical protein